MEYNENGELMLTMKETAEIAYSAYCLECDDPVSEEEYIEIFQEMQSLIAEYPDFPKPMEDEPRRHAILAEIGKDLAEQGWEKFGNWLSNLHSRMANGETFEQIVGHGYDLSKLEEMD